jgi:hypothetical protein
MVERYAFERGVIVALKLEQKLVRLTFSPHFHQHTKSCNALGFRSKNDDARHSVWPMVKSVTRPTPTDTTIL